MLSIVVTVTPVSIKDMKSRDKTLPWDELVHIVMESEKVSLTSALCCLLTGRE